MQERVTEVFGWYGVAAIVLAYALANFDMLSVHSLWYILLNLTGALGVGVDAYCDRNYQPVVLNVVWFLIAAVALVQVV